jgi:F-type H+-transporting ATPase subunit delta
VTGRSLTLARRYAAALLDVAIQQECAAAIPDALQKGASLAAHPSLDAALIHPLLPEERKRKLVERLMGRGKGEALAGRLLLLLAERRRLAILPDVRQSYTELWNSRRGVLAAEVVSAQPLSTTQHAALARALSAASSRQVELATHVDEAVLGGVLVRLGGLTIDGTLRRRLQALKESLIRGVSAH